MDADPLLHRIDRYLDAVPRAAAEARDVGPLRAFVSHAPWPYYARPRPELDLTAPDDVTPDDVAAVAKVLTEVGQPVVLEWVHEVVPSMADSLTEAGYVVSLHPLLALPLPAQLPSHPRAALLDGASPHLRAALAVAEVAFGDAGTAIGTAGPAARDAVELPASHVQHVGGRIADGSAVLAAVVDEHDGVVASGSHVPVDGATEIMGVATLPTHRRRGLAVDVVVALLLDATARGCDLALLSAADDDVARVYERIGFVRVGHAGAAEPGVLA